MKNIEELGLDYVKLEDQVLLVDENKERNIDDFYLSRNAWGLGKHEINRWTEAKRAIISGKDSKAKGVVISSTKQLEGLPLLVIEDEAEYYANLISKDEFPTDQDRQDLYRDGTLRGYNKVKETYKYTEEDLWQAVELSKRGKSFDVIKNFLNQKQLWVEVDPYYTDERERNEGINDGENIQKSFIMKITNNQIKAIWK